MRRSFFKVIEGLAAREKNIYIVSANLGFKLFDDFRSKYAGNFLDVGVAEPNMIGISAGMALCGKNVYCYSIIPFLLMRTYEQIRLDIASQNLKVKLVGAGGGFAYGLEGVTHFALEDLALMRLLPNMHIVVPADPAEAAIIARQSCSYMHPLYIRLGKTGDPPVHTRAPALKIGKGMVLEKGKDIAIFAIGSMVYRARQAARLLEKKHLSVTLVNMHTLRPLDKDLIRACSGSHNAIFTVEEHSIYGGLGSAVGEILLESGFQGKFWRFGIAAQPQELIGDADFLREKHGLTAEKITAQILRKLKRK